MIHHVSALLYVKNYRHKRKNIVEIVGGNVYMDGMKNFSKIIDVFLTFFKIGLFTFGGGYAMIAIIEEEIIQNKHWTDEDELLDMLAIAESTPGPLAVNTATFIGYKVGGIAGALAGTLGVILPSFIIISIISVFLIWFQNNKWIEFGFKGIRSGVLILMIGAVTKFGKKIHQSGIAFALASGAFCFVVLFDIKTIHILILSGIIGAVHTKFNANKEEE